MNHREPLAIVGIGCRFPGDVASPDDLFRFLTERRSGICEVPEDRWDRDAFYHPDFRKPGYLHVTRGGFLRDVDKFDASFFGISPNEAKRMDPQQRFILETAFEATEDAGLPLERLAGRSVAVVIGCGLRDYDAVLNAPTERYMIGGTSVTGSALSIIANRISYLFDLRGPSFAVDTACSSSITALHLACRSIWENGVEAALVGGVNMILKSDVTMGFSKGGYLSPDAECRAFSDDANGYVRSEGAAVVVIKKLAQAVADGDRIYALIRGTWVNQDGRTPGMTVPSREAQEELIRGALRDAQVDPAELGYVEAHGTGTPTGDPIEANAIGGVVGRAAGRTTACYIGSVKSNLGHMECAAGMAGLIKLALVLKNRTIVPNIHFETPNRKINFDDLNLRVATTCVEIPARTLAGISSFGFGGANAFAVLESPPPPVRASAQSDRPSPAVLALSARSPSALRTLAGRLAEKLEVGSDPVHAVADGLSRRRSRFEFRLAAVVPTDDAPSRASAGASLRHFAEHGPTPLEPGAIEIHLGRTSAGSPERPAFIFTGQGAQWSGMGQKLLKHRVFSDAIEEVDGALARFGWLGGERGALMRELATSKEKTRIAETHIAQPCIYALQVGLTKLLAEQGVTPIAVTGHSIGELAAAVAAGALSLEEGARIVYWRSRCQGLAEGKGSMAALGLSEEAARRLLEEFRGAVDLAAVNGPFAVTVAGTTEGIRSLVAKFSGTEVFCRVLDISVPFHSHLMDPIESDFRQGLGPVSRSQASIPFYSTVTGTVCAAEHLNLDYWYDNIRKPVAYYSALTAMAAAGVSCFLEVGPHPALMHSSLDAFKRAGTKATYIPTLRRDGDDSLEWTHTLAKLFVSGVGVMTGDAHAQSTADLPRYPFERQRFWLETARGRAARMRPECHLHPHLRRLARSVHAPDVFSSSLALDATAEPYLADHRVQGHIILPAAGQMEVVLAAARRVFQVESEVVLEDVEFQRPVVLSAEESDATEFQLEVYSDTGDFIVSSNANNGSDSPWLTHTRGRIDRRSRPAHPSADLTSLRARIAAEMPASELYRHCAESGLELGPSFRGITAYWRNDEAREFLARIESPASLVHDVRRFTFHPAMLDAILQTATAFSSDGSEGTHHRLYLPHKVQRIQIHHDVPEDGVLWAHARVEHESRDEVRLSVRAFDDVGRAVVTVDGFVARYVKGSAAATESLPILQHRWHSAPASGERPREDELGTWLVFGSEQFPKVTEEVERRLARIARRTVRVSAGTQFRRRSDDGYDIRPDADDDLRELIAAFDSPVAGIVHLWDLDGAPPGVGAAIDAVRRGALPVGRAVSMLFEQNRWHSKRRELWLVTHGVHAVPTVETHGATPLLGLSGSTLWGFGRSLASEEPRLELTLVDLGDHPKVQEITALGEEIARGAMDHEVAFRGDERFVQRLVASGESGHASTRQVDISRTAVHAVLSLPGVLDSLSLKCFAPKEIGPDEVEISVRAVSLIFRDVVAAMGMLTKDAWAGGLAAEQIGSDCAGIVTKVGANVVSVHVGDAVVAFAPHALATRAIAHHHHVAKILPGLSFADAACLPTCYSTVDVALRELARIQPGETILIHAAAGGVGVMAVQLAHHLGAKVIGTTSSDEKRAFLHDLGVEHVFNSRTPDFRKDILEVTNGEGVDVVLNSLSGRALTEGLRSLKPFGRFVDLAKVDIYKNRQMGMYPFGENRTYTCLDINRYYTHKSYRVQEFLRRSMEARTSGILKTLPMRRFGFEQSVDALQWFAQGKQIGKVVVDVPSEGTISAEPSDRPIYDSNGAYVVTGGCAGFGLAVAEWLAKRGAKKLVLASRSGPPSSVEKAKIELLSKRGVAVHVVRCDVSDIAQVRELVASAAKLGRLAGIFHCAMVLDDAPVRALDMQRYSNVLMPKAEGAWNLHEATLGTELDAFVMFSSIASVIGTPGQANYAAANAFLDQLASYRTSRNLRATTINWGILEGAGVVERASEDRRRKILSQGVRAFDVARVEELLDNVLAVREGAQHVVADVDWARFAPLGATARRPGRFSHLAEAKDLHAPSNRRTLRETLHALPVEERAPHLASAMGKFVGRIAGLGSAGVDVEASLRRYGLDSLSVAQFQTWIDEQLGMNVTMIRLLGGPSIVELTRELLSSMRDDAASTTANSSKPLLCALTHTTAPKVRIICFPFMGGDKSAFAQWPSLFPPEVALSVLDLPTFGASNEDLLLGPFGALRDTFVSEVEALLDVPYAVYGHSMGGFMAIEAVRELVARGCRAPEFVVLGAIPTLETVAKFMPDELHEVADLSPDDVTEEIALRSLDMMHVDPRVLLDPSMRAKLIGLVRRDLWVAMRAGFGGANGLLPPAGVPVVLLGGKDDPVPTLEKSASSLASLGITDVVSVPGTHLFLGEPLAQRAIVREFMTRIERIPSA